MQNLFKVLCTKGVKQVGQITAAERGELVTIGCCVSASGRALPPVMVFPRVNYKDHFIRGSPNGTLGLASSTSWMNAELFPQVLAHIIKHIGCSKQKPAMLLMDNHESHMGLEIIDMAKENRLTVLTFPPHWSHRLQPLDGYFYGSLKGHYKRAVDEWNLENPGKRITIYDIPECFSRAFEKTSTFANITAGFKKTGIWPLNSDVFTDKGFVAADVFIPGSSMTNTDTNQSGTDGNDQVGEAADAPPGAGASNDLPGTSADDSFTMLQELRPFPKATSSGVSKRGRRKRGYARVLTSTPEKTKLLKTKLHEELKKTETVGRIEGVWEEWK